MLQKRYQRFTKNGIEWTKWFNCVNSNKELIQFKAFGGVVLKNEYREV